MVGKWAVGFWADKDIPGLLRVRRGHSDLSQGKPDSAREMLSLGGFRNKGDIGCCGSDTDVVQC